MRIRRWWRRLQNKPYVPATKAEQRALDMWQDAALKGGFFWSALVGQHEMFKGRSVLSDGCSQCKRSECRGGMCLCDSTLCGEHRLALIAEVFEDR